MKLIERLSVAKFRVTTPNVKDGVLELDFNPIISEFNLNGNFTLINWQARPKGHRQWGIYSSADDTYRTMPKLKINMATVESLQLDDATASTFPSAVFYTDVDQITCINDKTVLGNVFLADVA